MPVCFAVKASLWLLARWGVSGAAEAPGAVRAAPTAAAARRLVDRILGDIGVLLR